MPVGLAHCGTEMLSLVALRRSACATRSEKRADQAVLDEVEDCCRGWSISHR
jgi:hypothetical protein